MCLLSAGAVRVHPSVRHANVAEEKAAVHHLGRHLRECQQNIMRTPPDVSQTRSISARPDS